MKKTLTLLWMASALWAAASCSKSEMDIREPETPSEESVESVKVNISVSGLSPDTKAIKKGWESGDIINVYLDDAENINTPDFTLTYDGSSWKASRPYPGTTPPRRRSWRPFGHRTPSWKRTW